MGHADPSDMSEITPGALGHPLEFPPEFKQWLADYVALQKLKFPISQVFGFALQRVRTATEDAEQTTASTTYTDLSTVGPTLSNVANGFYLMVFGADCQASAGSAQHIYMGLSINSATPSDDDACDMFPLYGSTARSSFLRVLMVQLNN